ncbi:hypothetical protein OOK06_18520 [Streptomyces sp. NBC_00340]|nr:hypothetical protein [Streptomyces sp. NBC_00340]MCX5134074.1 hypothetical protein [Streptomyces sp. NBC_00340]
MVAAQAAVGLGGDAGVGEAAGGGDVAGAADDGFVAGGAVGGAAGAHVVEGDVDVEVRGGRADVQVGGVDLQVEGAHDELVADGDAELGVGEEESDLPDRFCGEQGVVVGSVDGGVEAVAAGPLGGDLEAVVAEAGAAGEQDLGEGGPVDELLGHRAGQPLRGGCGGPGVGRRPAGGYAVRGACCGVERVRGHV